MNEYYAAGNVQNRDAICVPMPTIKGDPNVRGPIDVDDEWLERKRRKRDKNKEKEKREYEIKIIKLLASRENLKRKLARLNPRNTKDSKRIAKINIALNDIERELSKIRNKSGIQRNQIETGSKVARFFNRVKVKAKRIFKKVKKFVRKHSDVIVSFAMTALSIIGVLCTRRLVPV